MSTMCKNFYNFDVEIWSILTVNQIIRLSDMYIFTVKMLEISTSKL